MPTEQPSNVPAGDAPEPRDEASPGAVLADERLDTTPGGGGLGGSSAAEALGGSDRAPGGTAPNAPIDLDVTTEIAQAEREAQLQSLETDPATGGRASGG